MVRVQQQGPPTESHTTGTDDKTIFDSKSPRGSKDHSHSAQRSDSDSTASVVGKPSLDGAPRGGGSGKAFPEDGSDGGPGEWDSLKYEEVAELLCWALHDRQSEYRVKRAKAEELIPRLLRTMWNKAPNIEDGQSWHNKVVSWGSEGSDPEVISKSIVLDLGAILAPPFDWDSLTYEEVAELLRQSLQDRQSEDPVKRAKAEAMVPCLLHTMGKKSTKSKQRQAWHLNKATAWASKGSEPKVIAKGIVLGLGAIVAAPLAIAGATVGGTGIMLYGVGKVVQGIGMGLFSPAKIAFSKTRKRRSKRSV